MDPTIWVALIAVAGSTGGAYLASLSAHKFTKRQDDRKAAFDEYEKIILRIESDSSRSRAVGYVMLEAAKEDPEPPDRRVQRRIIRLWEAHLELQAPPGYSPGARFRSESGAEEE